MLIKSLSVLAFAAAILLTGGAPAPLEAQQRLHDNPQPAERPPASFQGTQFVDSRGCVFIRAGIDGVVTWVPRVTRNRELICGMQPTLGAGAQRPVARGASQDEGPRVVQITPVAPIEPTVSAPTPRPRVDTSVPAPVLRAPAQQPRITDQTLIAPPAVAAARAATVRSVPPGYRPAFDDGRFNPYRAVQTREGRRQMQQVWTDTVPRRLIER